jgi:anti-sigma factor RsiW
MSAHLSPQQVEQYRRRTLPPAELLDASDHLAACEACRSRVADTGRIDATLSGLREDFRQQSSAPLTHLDYQQLSLYVDDELDEVEREIVDSHTMVCASCKEELRDLFAFKDTLHATSDAPTVEEKTGERGAFWERISDWWQRPGRRSRLQFIGAMAALALISFGVWLALRTRQDSSLAELQPTPTPTIIPSPSPHGSPTPQPRESPADNANGADLPATPESKPTPQQRSIQPIDNPPASPLLALNDNGGQVTLDNQGNLSGLEAVSGPERQAVAKALRTGRLDAPDALADLRGKNGTLMGNADNGQSFTITGPAATVVSTERPTFRWHALEGATGYTVKVYDKNFSPVDSSPTLKGTEWTPMRPLAGGKVYTWQVAAIKDGSEVVSPAPPMPEARFKVLSRAEAEEVTRALSESKASHLARGVIYTRAGLLAEAEQEFEALLKLNPQSRVARKLLNDVRAMRRAG